MHGQHELKSGWSQMGWSAVWVRSTAIRVCQSSEIINFTILAFKLSIFYLSQN